jgi:hypothetical protein
VSRPGYSASCAQAYRAPRHLSVGAQRSRRSPATFSTGDLWPGAARRGS